MGWTIWRFGIARWSDERDLGIEHHLNACPYDCVVQNFMEVTVLQSLVNTLILISNSINCDIRASYKTWHQPLLSQVLPIQGIRRDHQSRLGKRLATRVGRSKVKNQSRLTTYSPISLNLHARENPSLLIHPRGPTVPVFWLRLAEDGYLPGSTPVPDFSRERERYDQRGRDREP